MKLLAFGEVLWDIYGDEKYIGGASFNFGAHFVRCGGEAYLLSAVGNDALGEETLKTVERYGVNSKHITVLPEKITGRCNVRLDDNTLPSYNLLDDVAYDYIDTHNVGETFDILYFGTLSLRNGYNRKSLDDLVKNNSFSEVFVDMNIRPPYYSDDSIKMGVEKASILKISDEELSFVTESLKIEEKSLEEICKALSVKFQNLKVIIITKGEKGSLCFVKDSKRFYYADAKPVKAVSTVGAGDSFGAAFAVKYFSGEDIESCLSYATDISAYVVSKKEAIPL